MQEIILSPKQYQALLMRFDEISNDLLLIKFKTGQETAFIDSFDLSRLLNVTVRTLRRWRKTGRLPYLKLNSKVYYRVDLLLEGFKVHTDAVDEAKPIQNQIPEHTDENWEMRCKCCPLLLLLTM